MQDLHKPKDIIDKETLKWTNFLKSARDLLGDDVADDMNPFHANFKPSVMAAQYLYKTLPITVSKCDPYMIDDDVINSNALTGGLIFAEPGTYNNVFEYDINSMYPSIMLEVDFITRHGEWKTLQQMPKLSYDDQYKIFRCRVTNFDNRLFQINRHNCCPALDLLTAQEEGFTLELIQDGAPNCLIYNENCRIPGKEVFSRPVNDLYKLKLNKVEGSKAIVNCMWGYLASRYIVKTDTSRKRKLVIDNLSQLLSMYPRQMIKKKQFYLIKTYHKKCRMKFRLGRFAPFLTARGRRVMYESIRSNKEHVVRVHTDGMITQKKIDGLKLSNDLGDCKVKQGSCTVHHVNKIEWN